MSTENWSRMHQSSLSKLLCRPEFLQFGLSDVGKLVSEQCLISGKYIKPLQTLLLVLPCNEVPEIHNLDTQKEIFSQYSSEKKNSATKAD